MNYINEFSPLKRVNATKFKNMIIKGKVKEFVICSNKVNPFSDFAYKDTIDDFTERIEWYSGKGLKEKIECYLNYFSYYNCNYNELGYYIAYYIKE